MQRAGPWLVAAAVVAAVVFALFSGGGVPDPVARGSQAPDFELPLLSGGMLELGDRRGQVVLLNFWATWCQPCEAEMPAMENLHQELSGEDFALLAISVDDEAAPVEQFRDRLDLTFPILLDPDQRVAAAFGSRRYPESWLIDRSGRVVERYIGEKPLDDPAYVARVRRLVDSGT